MHVCFIFPPLDGAIAQQECKGADESSTFQQQLLTWLGNVARSPLQTRLQEYICALVTSEDMVTALPEHSMDERVCMYGLAHACPSPKAQEMLRIVLQTSIATKLIPLCMRSDGRYGIRFTQRHRLFELQELKVTVRRLDFTVEYESKSDSLSNMVREVKLSCLL